jgi:hypothetical protein
VPQQVYLYGTLSVMRETDPKTIQQKIQWEPTLLASYQKYGMGCDAIWNSRFLAMKNIAMEHNFETDNTQMFLFHNNNIYLLQLGCHLVAVVI